MAKKEERKRRSLNELIDDAIASSEDISVAGVDTNPSSKPVTQEPAPQEQGRGEVPSEQVEAPTGIAAEKPCFITVAVPESIKRVVDMKVKYDSKELPTYNQTIKHIGRRWFLRGLLSEGLITQEQFDDASALHSEYGWEREKVAEKRRRK